MTPIELQKHILDTILGPVEEEDNYLDGVFYDQGVDRQIAMNRGEYDG